MTGKEVVVPLSIMGSRVEHGIAPMQKVFGDAILAVMNDPNFKQKYSGKTIQFAGPAFSGFSFQFINYWAPSVRYTLEQQFLDDMLDPKANLDPTTGLAKYNTSLDYFSFHYYNDFRNGTTSIPPSDPQWNAARQTTTLKAQTDLIRSKLAALGKPGTKLFVSDWGPSVDEASDINYSHKRGLGGSLPDRSRRRPCRHGVIPDHGRFGRL